MIQEIKDWKESHLNPSAGLATGGGGLQNELPAAEVSSFDKRPTEKLRDEERGIREELE